MSQILWEVGEVGSTSGTISAPLTVTPPPPLQAAGSPRSLPVALLRFTEALLPRRHLRALLPS